MIKKFELSKLDEVMQIWLETNIDAHNFVPKEYWIDNFDMVKEILPSAEIYIYQEHNSIKGFIGVVDGNYIAGLFVRKEYQGEGIGKKLINYCKSKHSYLILDVFVENKKAVDFYRKNDFIVKAECVHEDTKELEYSMSFNKK